MSLKRKSLRTEHQWGISLSLAAIYCLEGVVPALLHFGATSGYRPDFCDMYAKEVGIFIWQYFSFNHFIFSKKKGNIHKQNLKFSSGTVSTLFG
jgi:hypothetical protein